MKDKKLVIIFLLLLVILVLTLGVTYAFFSYDKVSNKTHSMIAGDISLTYNEETNTLSLTNVFPETPEEARLRNDNFITFTISGINTSTKDINYEIDLIHGDDITDKTRVNDEHLKFDLEETISGNTTMVVNNMSYSDLSNYLSIWVGHVPANTTSTITRTYKLRMWLSDEVTISDTKVDADYSTSVFRNSYASIKLRVIGDFNEHDYVKRAYDIIQTNAISSTTSSAFVTNTNGIDYGLISSDTNGKGLYILRGTENDIYPIAFYRGDVNNNNVIFGGFCWQIVRTTDTGGIKMIYNGVVTGNGTTCENTSYNDRIMTKSAFNTNDTSMSDVGYMYNIRYENNSFSWITNALFASSATWVTDHYELTDASVTTPDATHHYSCNATSSSATCTNIRYVYDVSGTTKYHITLTNGELIEDAIYKMTGNGTSEIITRNNGYVLNNTDSTIKTILETWFRTNLTNEVNTSNPNYVNYLEDTIWCNDRTFIKSGTYSLQESGWNPNGGSLSTFLYFETRNRFNNGSWYSTTNVPVTICERELDQFRVNNSKAPLNYPIGLLTADEVIMAGASGNSSISNYTYYLRTGTYDTWLATPANCTNYTVNGLFISKNGNLAYNYVSNNKILRGAISLKLGTTFEDGGDGTPTNPYVVKMN